MVYLCVAIEFDRSTDVSHWLYGNIEAVDEY
jgi:hypothetical protein